MLQLIAETRLLTEISPGGPDRAGPGPVRVRTPR